MPREGAVIVRDLIGKLEVLRVECDKCGRCGMYHLDRLIERYGIDAKLFDWEPPNTSRQFPDGAIGAVIRQPSGPARQRSCIPSNMTRREAFSSLSQPSCHRDRC
jgi:hypothetical protein